MNHGGGLNHLPLLFCKSVYLKTFIFRNVVFLVLSKIQFKNSIKMSQTHVKVLHVCVGTGLQANENFPVT